MTVVSVKQADAATARTGAIDLAFRRAPDGHTFIAHQRSGYPFHICRPHRDEGDPAGMATMYLQSVSGGVFEHDRLTMDFAAEARAAVHLTSQASTIVHAMTGGEARIATTLEAGPGAVLEYLPEATILFPGAALVSTTRVRAARDAVVLVGESFIAHDPDGGPEGCAAPFRQVTTDVLLEDDGGALLARDRQAMSGTAFQAMSIGRDPAFTSCGTVFLWAPTADLPALQGAIDDAIAALPDVYAGVSPLPGGCGLSLRFVAVDGVSLQAAWRAGWSAVREVLFGAPPRPRRK